ncbi:hypothetical protein Lal_00008541 [Lupinus albus]|nr:hypothetical protein Lal_00008541 [Lupinus albus]
MRKINLRALSGSSIICTKLVMHGENKLSPPIFPNTSMGRPCQTCKGKGPDASLPLPLYINGVPIGAERYMMGFQRGPCLIILEGAGATPISSLMISSFSSWVPVNKYTLNRLDKGMSRRTSYSSIVGEASTFGNSKIRKIGFQYFAIAPINLKASASMGTKISGSGPDPLMGFPQQSRQLSRPDFRLEDRFCDLEEVEIDFASPKVVEPVFQSKIESRQP